VNQQQQIVQQQNTNGTIVTSTDTSVPQPLVQGKSQPNQGTDSNAPIQVQQQQQQQISSIAQPNHNLMAIIQQQQQAQSVNRAVRKSWHDNSETMLGIRQAMCNTIVQLLQQKRPNANAEWRDKLPQMAKRLEDALYLNANNVVEYNDQTTLKTRLQQLALAIGGNKHQGSSAKQQMAPEMRQKVLLQQHQQLLQQQQQQQGCAAAVPGQVLQLNGSNQQVQSTDSSGQQQNVPPTGLIPNPNYVESTNVQGQTTTTTDSTSDTVTGKRQFVNMSEINPLIGGQLDGGLSHHQHNKNIKKTDVSSDNIIVNQQSQPSNGEVKTEGSSDSKSSTTGTTGHTDAQHRKMVLKQQQQRLLLLRHASKCPHETGKCPVTEYCGNMKQLWKHIVSCKEQDCKIPHCVSSRFVLAHYSKCKEPNCPVCGPVREAIKRNYEISQNFVSSNSSDGRQSGHKTDSHGGKHESGPATKKSKKALALAAAHAEESSALSKAKGDTLLDPISCTLYCLTIEQIQSHLKTITDGYKNNHSNIKEYCSPVLEEIMKVPHANNVFGFAVDPVLLNIPDYHIIVKNPMDLGTVKKKLETQGNYRDFESFSHDMNLVFDNAILYNPKGSDVHELAKSLKKIFESRMKSAITQFDRKLALSRNSKDICHVCCEALLNYEPPVYYCNGRCGGQRIR
jgi:E1A/CREB-binding protein